MVRGQLGFIHERLDGDDLAAARDIVEGWSRGLEEIAGLAAEGKWRPARDRLAALHAVVAAPPAVLANAGPQSLYNPVRLKAWLAKSPPRSEEHTSELQSLMRISYAVFCLKKKTYELTTCIYDDIY